MTAVLYLFKFIPFDSFSLPPYLSFNYTLKNTLHTSSQTTHSLSAIQIDPLVLNALRKDQEILSELRISKVNGLRKSIESLTPELIIKIKLLNLQHPDLGTTLNNLKLQQSRVESDFAKDRSDLINKFTALKRTLMMQYFFYSFSLFLLNYLSTYK